MTFTGTNQIIRTTIRVMTARTVLEVLEETLIGTADISVGQATETEADVLELLVEIRHRAAGVVSDHDATTTLAVRRRVHGTRPDIERRQVQVKVENFLRVQAFKETDLDGLHVVGGVNHRDQLGIATVDRVVRVDQNLAETVRVHVHRVGNVNETRDAGEAGDDGRRQRTLFHHNTPNQPQGFC